MNDNLFDAVPHDARTNPLSLLTLLGIVVGTGLVVFPEPATTATGAMILAGIFIKERADKKRDE